MIKLNIERNNIFVFKPDDDEPWIYIIDADNNQYCKAHDRESKLLALTPEEWEAYLNFIDKGINDYWDDITEIK